MERSEFAGVWRGIAMTGTAAAWAMVVGAVDDWQTAPIIALSGVLLLLGVVRLIAGAVELSRTSDFY